MLIIKIVLILLLSIFVDIKIYNYFKFKNNEYIEIKKITNSINNNYNNIPIKTTKEIVMESKEYIGYIKIKKYNINKLIMFGTSDSILNKNVVGLYKDLMPLDSNVGVTLLAGHNNNFVFKNLNKLEIDDEIIIGSKQNIYKYKVVSKRVISKNDFSIFEEKDERVVMLMTCVNEDLRLIIICK